MLEYNEEARADIAAFVSSKLSDGWLNIYNNADVLLVRFQLPISAFHAEAGGRFRLSGQWFGTAMVTGVANWFRITDRNERWSIEGSVSSLADTYTGDLILVDKNLTFGQNINITECFIEI